MPPWLIVACIGAVALCGFGIYMLCQPSEVVEEPVEEVEEITETVREPDAYIGEIPLYEEILPEEAAGRIGGTRDIEFVVIHETDNFSLGSDAQAHSQFLLSYAMENEHSWHYTVDDHEIYQHLPDEEPAYHAGDKLAEHGGNLNGIGIEICVAEDNDYEQSVENAAQLTAYLLLLHDLTPEDVQPHECFSGKNCPAQMLADDGAGWDNFITRVTELYEGHL